MGFSDERAAIESRFGVNWPFSTIPVAYDNVPFTPPPAGQDYLTCSIMSGRGLQMTIGDDPDFRYTGVIQHLIVCAKDRGTIQARIYADVITPIWRRQKFSLGQSGLITSWTPSFIPIGVKDGRYQAVLSCPYHRDEFMSASSSTVNPPVPALNLIKRYALSGTINGINKIFHLPFIPPNPDGVFFFWNGSLQTPPGDYTLVDDTITMTAAPGAGTQLTAYF